jgi:hypothetical protein
MKKLMFVTILIVLATSFALAVNTIAPSGNTAFVPTVDVQGGHENGGRGCAGCHAPHSGGRGSGTYGTSNVSNGDTGLWGTDTGIITNYISTVGINFDGGPGGSISALNAGNVVTTWAGGGYYTGLVTCLSCHDGTASKGAMMVNQSYEQVNGMLTGKYGTSAIPTLLGNDLGGSEDYLNDHPVGPAANLGKVLKVDINGNSTTAIGATFAVSGSKLTVTAGTGNYGQFAANYNTQAVNSTIVPTGGTAGDAYIVCTTCHAQHNMVVFSGKSSGITGNFQTYFFINGPYNFNAAYTSTMVPSTNRFCTQCHFSSHTSEYYGATNIGTAY